MVKIITAFEISKQKEQKFNPSVPGNLSKTGLNEKLIEDLIFKVLLSRGVMTGRQISDEICLHFAIIEPILSDLKKAAVSNLQIRCRYQ